MNNKLPFWKDRIVAETIPALSDKELAERVQKHYVNCVTTMKKIKKFTNENK